MFAYYVYIYINIRYLHYDIFRYLTREITRDISSLFFHAVLLKLITPVVIATG